jgi:putative PIN family toxin of toxin-antitoxin system
MSAKPTVVFDTQVLLRATINRKSLPARLFFDLRGTYHLAASTQTIAEAKDVLNRPVLREKFSALTDEAVAETLNLLANARQVILKEIAAASRDPKDDILLATALEAQAQYLVSEDNDLLVLDSYQGTRIINALDFLRVLQEAQAKDNLSPSA